MATPSTLKLSDPPNAPLDNQRVWQDWFRSFISVARTAVASVVLPLGYLRGNGINMDFEAVTSLPHTDIAGLGALATKNTVDLTSDVTGILPVANGGFPNTGISVTIPTAKLTTGGTNGSMTFTNGILTAQVAAT